MLAPVALALVMATAAPPADAVRLDRPITRHLQQAAFDAEPPSPAISFAQGSRRDSLRNGARTGAIVGGAIMAASIGWLCLATHEEGDPSCVGPVFLWTAVGTGAGTLVGAGIDALFGRRLLVQGSVKW